jgi:hypothetical protein
MKTIGYKKAKKTGIKVLGLVHVHANDKSHVAGIMVTELTPLQHILRPGQHADVTEVIAFN